MLRVRCDDAVPGASTAGCVFPEAPGVVVYERAKYPELARHAELAQQSGLPGAGPDRPLTYTTDEKINKENRRLACGDAPSVPGKSCDEYPVASSRQGLTAGGTRRTFDDCGFDLPRQTGPTGVSVCMIDEKQNSAQGGLHAGAYRQWRMLDGDSFVVAVD